jgi:hypothetical protein
MLTVGKSYCLVILFCVCVAGLSPSDGFEMESLKKLERESEDEG